MVFFKVHIALCLMKKSLNDLMRNSVMKTLFGFRLNSRTAVWEHGAALSARVREKSPFTGTFSSVQAAKKKKYMGKGKMSK